MFKLNRSGTFANKIGTTEWHNVDSSTEYLAWIGAGNNPEQPDQYAVYSATPWQIRKALTALSLRQQVEYAVAASSDQEVKDGWEFATEFRSDDPFVIAIGAAVGKTAEETAQVINYASTL